MRTVTYYIATSLDGRIAAPEGDVSGFLDAGDHMDAILDEFADTIPGHLHDPLGVRPDGSRFDTVVMGWNTYTPALDVGIEDPYPHLRTVVATGRERPVPERITTTADPVATLRGLRREDGGGIWIAGGAALAGALIDEIDALILKINPVVLGDGIPLFAGADPAARPFERTAARTFDSGVVIAEYARAAVS